MNSLYTPLYMNKTAQTITLGDGRRLGFAEYGDFRGKPIFYFHGWPPSRLQAGVTDEVGKRLGIRIISIDRPGFGLSDFQENRQLLDWPDDVVELADQLKIKKFSVVGVSGGGPYAAVCAFKIPDRLMKVGIVVGLSPITIKGILDGMPFLPKLGWANYPKSSLLRKFAANFQYFLTFLPSLGVHRFLLGAKSDQRIYNNPEVRARFKQVYREAFRQGPKGPELDLKLYSDDWNFDLRKIRAKVFLFYGEADKNVPLVMGKYYKKLIPNSVLKVYPDEGHLISRTHIEEILKIL
jgi:pimeloyl-ACP methyl ester carboxylesterase